MTISTYLTDNSNWIDERSAAAITQLNDAQWPAVLAALDEYSGGATDPGIDCNVAITHETLADFDDARANHWSERGSRDEHNFDGIAAIKYERFQLTRGQERRDMVVLDLGAVRLSLY